MKSDIKKGDRVLLSKRHNNSQGIITFCSSRGTVIMVKTTKGEEFPTDMKYVKLKLKDKLNAKKNKKSKTGHKEKSKDKTKRIKKESRIAEIRRRNKLKNRNKL